MNFYCCFIEVFMRKTLPLTNLLKGGNKKKNFQQQCQERFIKKLLNGIFLDEKACKVFKEVKRSFADSVLLYHFNPSQKTCLKTDASIYVISRILSQLLDNGNWVPITFYSQKMVPMEINYRIYNQKLLTIMESFRHWWHYLKGMSSPILV